MLIRSAAERSMQMVESRFFSPCAWDEMNLGWDAADGVRFDSLCRCEFPHAGFHPSENKRFWTHKGQPLQPFLPPGPPPRYIPKRPDSANTGSLKGCRKKWTFIWLKNGSSFWMWIRRIYRRTIIGTIWTGCAFSTHALAIHRIESFRCH